MRVHVKDGKVVRVDADNTGEDSPGIHEIRACLRGRALRKWVYSPERLLYPLKRVGKRGEGKFERISWDEALDRVSDKLRQVIDTYGNEAVFRIYGTGNLGGVVSGREQIDRLMNLLGRATQPSQLLQHRPDRPRDDIHLRHLRLQQLLK